MEKDYSEYEKTEYDLYLKRRANLKDARLDYFSNSARFNAEDKIFHISVDDYNEHINIDWLIEEYETDRAKREGREYKKEETEPEIIEENMKTCQEYFDKLRAKYNFYPGICCGVNIEETGKLEYPLINVFSGAGVTLKYGEGILDFIYADFLTPLKEAIKNAQFENFLIKTFRKEKDDETSETINLPQKEKVYNDTQEIVENFFDYESSFGIIKDIAYASLYSAICPPVFHTRTFANTDILKWYGSYLLYLRDEFREIIEFCYDEDFYPEIFGNLYPSERFNIYRKIHDFPIKFRRNEEFTLTHKGVIGKKMPYGLSLEEMMKIFSTHDREPTEEEKAFAKKYNYPVEDLLFYLRNHSFIRINYSFRSVAEILELELTKMFEQNVHFRKCKRCGKYFIMKGKYDTRYCDRVAEGESRTCQEIAAAENYKAKHADDKATAIYSKYYKRYSARVKVRQIKEADFKKWKYQAITKRDECTNGDITPEEFTEWMEACFPNRKKKD